MHAAMISRPASRRSALLAGLLGIAICAVSVPSLATPSEDLAKGEAHYSQGNYQEAVDVLAPLFVPRTLLADPDAIQKAHLLLARAYFFLGREDDTKRELASMLTVDPGYQLDPALEDADFYVVYDSVRRELKEKLAEIEQQRRLEEERRRRPQTMLVVERHYYPYQATWHNWLPFAVPQLERHVYGRGLVLFGVEASAATISMYGFFTQYSRYGWFHPITPTTPTERDNLTRLQWAQYGGAVVFFAAWGVGVWDAYRHQQPDMTETRRVVPITETARLPRIAPLASPEATGVSLSWEF